MSDAPKKNSYDVVIVGGAMMGSSAAWFLTENPDFDGSVLVVERDPTYATASTTHTNSCMRQQFSADINVRVSQFAAEFVKSYHERIGLEDAPKLGIQSYGYMYLADTEEFAQTLRENIVVQHAAGAATKLMTPEEIKRDYPFYNVDDILLGSINLVDEGYWDGSTVFDGWRRSARKRGVEYLTNEVVAMTKNAAGNRVESVTLASGEVVACGQVVNASGPRAAQTAAMAGLDIPVEPRKRFTWIFKAEKPLDRDLPLTIDPCGVHCRENGGGTYLAGGHTDYDPAVAHDDFSMDADFWQDFVWPALATRIPQFEAIKITSEWAGHYAYNTLDHNAVLGANPAVENFLFLNGFSGHGLQQSPAMGRGISELLTYGEYRTLDLSPFGYDRILRSDPLIEKAVI